MTIPEIIGLKQERKSLFEKGKENLDKAERNQEDMNAYDAIMADFDKLTRSIDEAEALNDRAGLVETEIHKPEVEDRAGDKPEYRKVFEKLVRYGKDSLSREDLGVLEEKRAMSAGTTTAGGYAIPDEFQGEIVKKLANVSAMRNLARIITTSGDRKIPIQNATGAATWTAEAADYTDVAPTLTEVSLDAYKLTFLVKISEELAHDEAVNLMDYVSDCYATAAGEAQETRFFQGTGSSQINGACTAAAAGVTAASETAITMDELLGLKFAVKPSYWFNGSWTMAPSTALLIRKLKDSSGRYLWQPSLQIGQPDMLDGNPVYLTAGMPAATEGLVPVLFGDFKYYWIAERGARVIQVLNERFADAGQIGFRAYERIDGDLTQSEAVKKLTMAAST